MLRPAVRHALLAAVLLFAAAIGQAVLVLSAFDWSPGRVLAGTGLGAVIWGALLFLTEDFKRVPRRELLPPPSDARIERVVPRGWAAARAVPGLLAAAALAVGMVYLVKITDLGATFTPGFFAGGWAASLLEACLIARWERRGGRCVLTGMDVDGDVRLYAV